MQYATLLKLIVKKDVFLERSCISDIHRPLLEYKTGLCNDLLSQTEDFTNLTEDQVLTTENYANINKKRENR